MEPGLVAFYDIRHGVPKGKVRPFHRKGEILVRCPSWREAELTVVLKLRLAMSCL